jgi:hypothetical protein
MDLDPGWCRIRRFSGDASPRPPGPKLEADPRGEGETGFARSSKAPGFAFHRRTGLDGSSFDAARLAHRFPAKSRRIT